MSPVASLVAGDHLVRRLAGDVPGPPEAGVFDFINIDAHLNNVSGPKKGLIIGVDPLKSRSAGPRTSLMWRPVGIKPLLPLRAERLERPGDWGYGFTRPRATARSAASALVDTSIFS